MQKKSKVEDRRRLLLCLFIFGLIAALVYVPYQFNSSASGKKVKKGLFNPTKSHDEEIENYDIRENIKSPETADVLASYRQKLGKDSAIVADIRSEFVRGEEEIKSRIPNVKIEYNSDIRTPEVITPDVWKSKIEWLSNASTTKRSEILRNFVKENNSLIGVNDEQADSLKVLADYTNPDGNLSFAHLEQRINGIPVFRGEVKAGFTKDGRIIRVINNLAAGLDYNSLSTDFHSPVDAIKAAAGYIKLDPNGLYVTPNEKNSTNLKTVFGEGDFANTAEKMYFPTEPGVAIPAWRVLIWQPVNAYYVIVSADNGTLLWRKNLTEDQTQSATYNVYANSNAYINVADSPFPLSPGPIDPTLGTQGAAISRTSITRIGNESPYTFNQLGWITDGNNTTDGNNVQAGLDRKLPNTGSPANPADIDPDGMATGNPNRVFNFPITPGNPNTNSGDSPLPTGQSPTTCLASTDTSLPTDVQKATATQLFYIVNRYHDEMYRLGFTESAFNFQNTNFTGQGAGNDRVSAQAQDCSGSDNANFTTPADGTRPTMQMYLWTGPNPDFDGSLDAEVVIHEHTHGLSNRLHGNASGLSSNMSRGMGEGWSDFYSYTMLAEPTDPINGVYTTGGYATYLITGGFTANYYYGIRRFPRAPITLLGSNGKPHNPYTFQYVNANCNTLIGTTTSGPNSAFPRGPIGSSTCDQVHNLGEIWSSALWEVRNRMVTRLGFNAGTTRVLQVVTDGMKLAPVGPTFLQERDAIIAAAAALPLAPEASADVVDVRDGFRVRGMGFSAAVTNAGTGSNNTIVVEGFDFPNAIISNPITVSDSTGNNNGFPEPGETVQLSVPVTNTTGSTMTNVVVTAAGGGSANYGSINDGQTVTRQIPYAIPANAVCGSQVTVNLTLTSDAGTQAPRTFTFTLGQPQGGLSENFDGVTAPALPAGWVQNQTSGTQITWTTSTATPNSAPNAAFAADPAAINATALESPAFNITSAAATVTFKNNYNTESTFDGMVLEIKIGSGAWTDIVAAGGSFTAGGYNAAISTAWQSPIAGRQAWTGNSNGYITSTANLPASANGQSVQLRWLMASDVSVSATGVRIDDIQVVSGYTCVNPPSSSEARADFDGDGKSDYSVFRTTGADVGTWYLLQSQAGFNATKWGIGTDTPVPGDYNGDNKTDFAVFRADANSANPDFWVLNSVSFTLSGVSWGLPGDIPVVADYDADGKDDFAVYRPSTNVWYILKSGGGSDFISFGQSGDVPVTGDFNGDGKGDLVVYRSGTWVGQLSGGGTLNTPFGSAGDILVPADYNGDGKDDLAVFRPSTGQWIYQPSGGGSAVFVNWGTAGDVPVPGDYNGDGKDDFAIYRNGQWWVNYSSGGTTVANFGIASDKAIPRSYLP